MTTEDQVKAVARAMAASHGIDPDLVPPLGTLPLRPYWCYWREQAEKLLAATHALGFCVTET